MKSLTSAERKRSALEVPSHDPLSQSLPSWSLKAMKEKENVKCVYDSRLFSGKSEEDLEIIEQKKETKKDNFKEFLNTSFNKNHDMKTSKVCNKCSCVQVANMALKIYQKFILILFYSLLIIL